MGNISADFHKAQLSSTCLMTWAYLWHISLWREGGECGRRERQWDPKGYKVPLRNIEVPLWEWHYNNVTSHNTHKTIADKFWPIQIPVTTLVTSTQLLRFPEPSFCAQTWLLSTPTLTLPIVKSHLLFLSDPASLCSLSVYMPCCVLLCTSVTPTLHPCTSCTFNILINAMFSDPYIRLSICMICSCSILTLILFHCLLNLVLTLDLEPQLQTSRNNTVTSRILAYPWLYAHLSDYAQFQINFTLMDNPNTSDIPGTSGTHLKYSDTSRR